LLTVPGNHDLTRPTGDAEHHLKEVMRTYFLQAQQRGRFWQDAQCEMRCMVDRSFNSYSRWQAANLDFQKAEGKIFPAMFAKGVLPGDFSCFMEKRGYRVGIVGLNTAFMAMSGEILEDPIVIDPSQVWNCLSYRASEQFGSNDVNLLLTHHPALLSSSSSSLDVSDDIDLSHFFAAHMCGHLHDAAYSETHLQPGSRLIRIQTPSLFSNVTHRAAANVASERLHGYTVIELQIDDDTASMRWLPRVITKDRRWVPDSARFTLSRDGWATMPVDLKQRRTQMLR